jgi:pyrroloquinoline quinone biosynthesis protein B
VVGAQFKFLLFLSLGMLVKVLGSAAGGGFPQWNCSCGNCRRLREDNFQGSPRTQAQLAWTANPGQWTLLSASPDLRAQIEATPDLWPQEDRKSPISDVIITSAEVDQILGLLLLREFHSFRVHCTASVRRILTEDNSLFRTLARFPGQVCWEDILPGRSFSAGRARLEVLSLPGSFPGFVTASRREELCDADAVIGLLISSESSGRTLAFLPSVGSVPDDVLDRLETCDIVLFDGTFWSDDEPLGIPGITRTASQMGHLPVSGTGGSLQRLAALQGVHKIYIHINNTNPMLDEASEQNRMVRDFGWEIAWDGMELTL